MSSNKILTKYVSETDQFLNAFDKQHPGLSKSQKKEVAKSARVSRLRDGIDRATSSVKKIWDGF